MIGPLSGPVLSASEVRAAEARAIAQGVDAGLLMDRAGRAVADLALRMGAGRRVLVLAGPGNNGGDGYVAARSLAERGVAVAVAQCGRPRSSPAAEAAQRWTGETVALSPDTVAAPVVVDALFGTGLSRPIDAAVARQLARLVDAADHRLAVDLPSGIDADGAAGADDAPRFDATLALGVAKPAHLLLPAAARCGRVMIADIGLEPTGRVAVLARPAIAAPAPDAHKYARGMVAVVGGTMAGAALLAAEAALRGGAGYVALVGGKSPGGPRALVRARFEAATLADDRIGAIVIGCGLGSGAEARDRFDCALASRRPLVIDGDALSLLADGGLARLADHPAPLVLTPHGGEFDRLFGAGGGDKIARTVAAARSAGAVVIHKGADTVVADADGRARVLPLAPSWLASAGTGDVLAGIVGARLAAVGDAFAAACEAVWLHAEAARIAGPALIADDLSRHLRQAIARCR